MNGYYTNDHEYTAYQRKSGMERMASRAEHLADGLFALIACILCLLRDRTIRRVARYTLLGACFFCFIGLIGGIEHGLVSVGVAIVLSLFLIFVEVLCLK